MQKIFPVEWNVRDFRYSKSPLVFHHGWGHVRRMVMQNDRYDVDALGEILAPGLIDMQIQPKAQSRSLKKSGEVRTSPF